MGYLQERHRLAQRRACRLVQCHRATVRYRPRLAQQDPVRERLRVLAAERPRVGYRRLTVLVRREYGAVNHKRVYRRSRQEGLAVRRRRRKRVARTTRPVPPEPPRAGLRWAMAFLQDVLADGRTCRMRTVVDRCTRECLAIEGDTALPGRRVARVLDHRCERHGRPAMIRVDNGPEFAGQALDAWAYQQGVQLDCIDLGTPMQNGYLERCNGTFRDECRTQHWFLDRADARRRIEAWRVDDNTVRPHSALGHLPPVDFTRRLTVGGDRSVCAA